MTPMPTGVEEIGTPTATYAPAGRMMAWNLIGSLFFILLGFGLFFAGPIGYLFSSEGSWFCATGLGLLAGAAGLWGLYDWFNTRKLQVHVSPVGVAQVNHGKTNV